jgi:hypothetical protein
LGQKRVREICNANRNAGNSEEGIESQEKEQFAAFFENSKDTSLESLKINDKELVYSRLKELALIPSKVK